MPYPNFHSARVREPGDFVRIVVLETLPNGIMIYGGPLKKGDGSTAQAYRFPKDKFTVVQAKAWLKEHDIKYISFEAASEPKRKTIKAVGDWELDVLAVPYGGPNQGRDKEGEYFSEETNLYLDKFDSPIVSYYHGFDPDGYPQGEPEEIGEVISRESKSDGLWVRVLLDKASEYAKRVWEAAKEGLARASSGTIEHIRRVARDGLITHWPFVELALFDTEGDRQPANDYAVALPVMKAAYKQAGRKWPEIQDPKAEAEAERQSAEADLGLLQAQARAREFLLGE